jgi:hypothetical protein
VPTLLAILFDVHVLETLATIGDARIIDPILQAVFIGHRGISERVTKTLRALVPFSSLTEAMVHAICDASFQWRATSGLYTDLDIMVPEQDSTQAFVAVRSLCAMDVPATSNIFQLIAHRGDLGSSKGDVTFGGQRHLATSELRRRGVNDYRPRAYLQSFDRRPVFHVEKDSLYSWASTRTGTPISEQPELERAWWQVTRTYHD